MGEIPGLFTLPAEHRNACPPVTPAGHRTRQDAWRAARHSLPDRVRQGAEGHLRQRGCGSVPDSPFACCRGTSAGTLRKTGAETVPAVAAQVRGSTQVVILSRDVYDCARSLV